MNGRATASPGSSPRTSSSNDASAASNDQPPASSSLTLLGDPGQRVRVAGQVEPELAALELDAGPAGHLGDQDPHVVADHRRVDVVVEHRIHLDRARVQPRLVGEGGRPDVGLVGVGGDVGDLGDGVRDPHHLFQAAVR